MTLVACLWGGRYGASNHAARHRQPTAHRPSWTPALLPRVYMEHSGFAEAAALILRIVV